MFDRHFWCLFCLLFTGIRYLAHVLTVPPAKACLLCATPLLSCCLTSTEARWPIRDGDRVGRRRESEGSTAETVRKRPERPWTAARTMEVLRRCPLAIAQRLVHCAIAVSTAVLDRVTKTMSVAPLLTNNLDNSKQKTSNLLSPAPPPYYDLFWANLRVQLHFPPLRSLDLLISPGTLCYTLRHGLIYTGPRPKALTECSPLDFRRSSIVGVNPFLNYKTILNI